MFRQHANLPLELAALRGRVETGRVYVQTAWLRRKAGKPLVSILPASTTSS